MKTSRAGTGKFIGWLLLSVLLFYVLGWALYPSLMELASPSDRGKLVAVSVSELFLHRTLSALSFAFIGAAVAASAALYQRISLRNFVWPSVAFSLFIGAVVIVFGLLTVNRRLASVADLTSSVGTLQISLPLNAIPLPFVAAVAGIVVLLMGYVFSYFSRKR